ncbi:hypothetical protein GCM10027299_35480 [Larkinella ripae]
MVPSAFRLVLCLLLAHLSLLQSCRFFDIAVVDYPPLDRSQLKGPDAKTLKIKTFYLSETLSFPFEGSVSQFNQQFLLVGHNEAAGRLALLNPPDLRELPTYPLNAMFVTPSGSVWGITLANQNFTLCRLTNGSWVDEGTISENYYYQTVRVTDEEIWFMTLKGLAIWDINQKKIRQQIPVDRSRLFTETFSVESADKELLIFRNQDLLEPVARFPLTDVLAVRTGISNDIWGVFEDKNRHLWLVVKDAHWDGILLKFEGNQLNKLTTIPVGNYDSGRGVSQVNLDKTGNLWVKVDGINYLYTSTGQWLIPQFDLLENTQYAGSVFTDSQGNLVVASPQKCFSLKP